MKIAIAGKGGVGKTTLTAWLGNTLALCGKKVWLVDADTASSLGQASGLKPHELPPAIASQEELLLERINPTNNDTAGLISLTPMVEDLPEKLAVSLSIAGKEMSKDTLGSKNLLLMGGLHHANGGCACAANALLKALLAHLILERSEYVLVDLEAGVEHLGRGTIASVDILLIVAEPSFHSLNIAGQIATMAKDFCLDKQILVVNRLEEELETFQLPKEIDSLPNEYFLLPLYQELYDKRLRSASVLDLERENQENIYKKMLKLIERIESK